MPVSFWTVWSILKIEKGQLVSLHGRTALVTGATSGIGRAAAEALAADGAAVIVTGRDVTRGEEVVAAITANGGEARFVAADLSSLADVTRLADEAGTVDILVNNAGIFPFGPTEDVDEATFDGTFAMNVKAPFFLTGKLAPRMAANGGGAIINVSTMVADFGMAGMAAYGASKAAANLLTKAWAAEYGPRGVRVNAVQPGPTRTPGTDPMGSDLDALASTLPLGRPATAEEIAEAIRFLASDGASYVNGAIVPVDGGRTAI
jgi:NAD(P)-dependent dehydrogenase (short-subunit alcohol dehydrogenase family)